MTTQGAVIMRDEKGEKLEEATYECEAGVRLELSKPDCEYGRDTLFRDLWNVVSATGG